MPKFVFNKLVRDKIVERQIASGAKPLSTILPKNEHILKLIEKIKEEAAEILIADKQDIADELADVQQALDDLRVLLAIDETEVAAAQSAKAMKFGTFAGGQFVSTIELEERDEWVAYYRAHKDQYPEITE